MKNIYEKVIPGLKRNVLSARISKLQVKSEALTEPYISALKKLGLVVTGASHFVGIVDFIKICKYFQIQPPDNLTKFYAINSSVNPEDVLSSFSAEKTELSILDLPTSNLESANAVQNVPTAGALLSAGVEDIRPGSSGSGCSLEQPVGEFSPSSVGEGKPSKCMYSMSVDMKRRYCISSNNLVFGLLCCGVLPFIYMYKSFFFFWIHKTFFSY